MDAGRRGADDEGDKGVSVVELAEQTGLSRRIIRERLGVIARAGRLVTAKVIRPAIDGGVRYVPVYRIK